MASQGIHGVEKGGLSVNSDPTGGRSSLRKFCAATIPGKYQSCHDARDRRRAWSGRCDLYGHCDWPRVSGAFPPHAKSARKLLWKLSAWILAVNFSTPQ